MPHKYSTNPAMKRIFFFVALAIAAVSFTSCLTSDDHSTPFIRASYLYRSTLDGVQDTVNYGDTVHVGDTLRGPIVLIGGYNNLTELQVSIDTTECDFHLLIDSGYSSQITAASKPEKGYLRFADEVYLYPTTLWFVPKKTGDLMISLTLSSTAGDKYSPLNAYFITPVR